MYGYAKPWKFVPFLLAGLTGGLPALTQADDPLPVSPDGVWESLSPGSVAHVAANIWLQPDRFRLVKLNEGLLGRTLSHAGQAVAAAAAPVVMHLPMPDGSFARFRIAASPIMAPALAAKFPQIKTYLGQGLDDPASTVRFDTTPKGFHAQVLSPHGAVYIDPYLKGNTSLYTSYYKRDYRQGARSFACSVFRSTPAGPQVATASTAALPSGSTLRTYRLAVAATGEYTQFHGGTVADGMAAIVTAINRVSGIYEVEVAVRMELVPNNDLIVYTDPATDPYTNSNGFTMLGQNQSNIDTVIGSSNYDIGHVFSTGGGGVAFLGVVCSGTIKAQGVTGLPNPIGDPFYVDFVAHEMGHQFGGNHSFNGINSNCCCGNRNASTAYEPGSGSTIQAYAGICGPDNLQLHSDPYFHSVSFDEIRNYVTTGLGGLCPVVTTTGNVPPIVDAGPDHTIPRDTPFVLTATANDAPGDILTYDWEERDLGTAAALSVPDNGSIPLFRSFNPTTSPSRTFPRLSDLLGGTTNSAEKLPATNRTMRFRVTVRDNRAGGGGVNWDEMLLTVDASSGPFRVISPDGSTNLQGNVTVTWDVAGTNVAPVNTPQVNILLSIDDGNTYPFTLAAATPNDGSETVTIPNVETLSARIKVEAVGNVFFAVSGANVVGSCQVSTAPQPDNIPGKNRYLSFTAGQTGISQAIRVTFVDLPAPFDVLNGQTMWVGPSRDVSELPGVTTASPPTFKAATLQCNPLFADWSALGMLHVYHAGIVPGGVYSIQVISNTCSLADETTFSAPLMIPLSQWGDVAGLFDSTTQTWSAPDNSVDVIIDAVSILNKFTGKPGSPIKARADIEPATPDQIINITDVIRALEAFRGMPYPFPPGAVPCP